MTKAQRPSWPGGLTDKQIAGGFTEPEGLGGGISPKWTEASNPVWQHTEGPVFVFGGQAEDSDHGGRTGSEGSAWATGHVGPAWSERKAVWPRRVYVEARMWEPMHTNGAGDEGHGP